MTFIRREHFIDRRKKKHLKKLSNLLSLLGILILTAFVIDNFKYSEYVLLIIAVLSGITAVYINTSILKTKHVIKQTLYPARYNIKGVRFPYKIKIYNVKTLDRLDLLASIFLITWAIIYLLWSTYKIIVGVF